MKYVKLEQLNAKRILEKETFNFHCHSKLSCFNQCCRNINLFLYPYDVIRLKKNLGINSDEFIDNYTDIILRPNNFFPDVLLRMSDIDEKTCPFLVSDGCLVYLDRPDACRTFPIEQGIINNSETNIFEFIYFFRPPKFCKGQFEEKTWTQALWAMDQKAVVYNQMTTLFAELKLLFQNDPYGNEGQNGAKAKMVFMATYNLDNFKEFLFNSTFLKRFDINKIILKKAKTDDVALMKIGFDWIKLFLWGIKSINIKEK